MVDVYQFRSSKNKSRVLIIMFTFNVLRFLSSDTVFVVL